MTGERTLLAMRGGCSNVNITNTRCGRFVKNRYSNVMFFFCIKKILITNLNSALRRFLFVAYAAPPNWSIFYL